MRIFTATALALVLSVAVASGASPSGLHGLVLIDPAYPVCKVGVPCTRPAKNVWLVFLRHGHTARIRTGDDSRYRITLPAETYTVTSPNHLAGRGLTPWRVAVRAGAYGALPSGSTSASAELRTDSDVEPATSASPIGLHAREAANGLWGVSTSEEARRRPPTGDESPQT